MRKEEKGSRIIISNLSEREAISLVASVKNEGIFDPPKSVRFELDRPDPPDLLEEEYDRINEALIALSVFLDEECQDFGEASTKKEVAKDIATFKKVRAKIAWLTVKFGDSIDSLEAGLKKLK